MRWGWFEELEGCWMKVVELGGLARRQDLMLDCSIQ